jgi:hypothetical protein
VRSGASSASSSSASCPGCSTQQACTAAAAVAAACLQQQQQRNSLLWMAVYFLHSWPSQSFSGAQGCFFIVFGGIVLQVLFHTGLRRVTVVRRGASHRLPRWHRASSIVPHRPSQIYSGAQGCFSSSSTVASCSRLCSTQAFAELQWCVLLHNGCMPVLPGGGCSSSQVGMVCARRGAATPARHPLPTFMVAPRLAPHDGVS